jgi:hypothetical protein
MPHPAVIPDLSRRDPTRSDHTMTKRHDIAGLAVPWAAIVALACVSLYFVDDLSSTVPEFVRDRFLTADSSQNYKPIINEEHDPLFPLSKSDIYGFSFAILGLMVSFQCSLLLRLLLCWIPGTFIEGRSWEIASRCCCGSFIPSTSQLLMAFLFLSHRSQLEGESAAGAF